MQLHRSAAIAGISLIAMTGLGVGLAAQGNAATPQATPAPTQSPVAASVTAAPTASASVAATDPGANGVQVPAGNADIASHDANSTEEIVALLASGVVLVGAGAAVAARRRA